MFEQTLTTLSQQMADQFVLNQVNPSSPTVSTPIHSSSSSKQFGKYGCLVLLKTGGEEGASFPLQFDDKTAISFGRYPQNDIVINLDFVSRIHARIVLDDNALWLTPISKTNATFLNHEQINESVSLEDGDVIEIGGKQFKFLNVNSNVASQHTSSFPMPEKLSFEEDYSLTMKNPDFSSYSQSANKENILISPMKQHTAFTSYKPTPQRASTVKSRFYTSLSNNEDEIMSNDDSQHQILKRKSNGRKSVSFASNLVNQLVYTISETTNEIVKLKQLETAPLKRPREENTQIEEEEDLKRIKLDDSKPVQDEEEEFSLGLSSKENSPSVLAVNTVTTIAPTVLEAIEVPNVSHFLPIATPNRFVQSSLFKHELKSNAMDVFNILDAAVITPTEIKVPVANFDQLLAESTTVVEDADKTDEETKKLIERIEQMKVVELRKELSKYGISTAGRKQELIDKLKNHLCYNKTEDSQTVVTTRRRKGRK